MCPDNNMLYQKADNGKLSGRADGNVYMRNGRVRGMRVPALVRTAATATARSRFSTASSAAWAALSDDDRQNWNDHIVYFKTNRFGVPVGVKGKEAFVRTYTNCQACGVTFSGPIPLGFPPEALESFSGAAASGAGTFTATYTATPLAANCHVRIFATAQQKETIYRPKNSAYRSIFVSAAAAASPANIFAAYTAKFGSLVATGKIFLRAIVIDETTGFSSAPVEADLFVAP